MTFHPRQRIQHKTLGAGTVVEVAGDAVRVELDSDDGARVRVFMASLGTIEPETPASGSTTCASSTASAAAAATLTTSPPPAAVAEAPAARLRSQPRDGMGASAVARANPSPAPGRAETQARQVLPSKPKQPSRSAIQESTTMANPLIDSMNEAITVRGPGSGGALCASLGLAKNSYKNWRHKGEIPQRHRDGVQAWINAPWKPKPLSEIAPKKAKSAAAKPAIKIPPANPMPPISRPIDHSTVLQAFGLTITTAWLPAGDVMRQVRVAILP